MASSAPRVSAIMIFLNAAPFIDEAIQSVFAQQYQDWELLLVDDGSGDGSTEIARRYAAAHPERVRYLTHTNFANRGMSASRNLGVSHARGEYVAFLDADDVWLPGKFSAQVPLLDQRPNVAMLYGPTLYWYGWTGRTEDQARDHVPPLDVPPDIEYPPGRLSTALYPLGTGTAPCMCSVLVRTRAVKAVGGFEESFRGFYEDQAFLSKMYLRHTILVTSGCWDRYRMHDRSCSAIVRLSEDAYIEYRGRFLQWFKEYVDMQPEGMPEVRRALSDAIEGGAAASGEPPHKALRLLRVAEGNAARLIFPHDNTDATRIDISQCEKSAPWDIQLSQPRLSVRGGDRYSVSFLARADAPRSVAVGFAKGQAPWTNLGLYDRIELAAEWQTFEREFVASESDENARIHFDAGDSGISLEVACVVLRSLSEGRFVRPGSAPGRTGPAADEPEVEPGQVKFGSFRRVTPISQDFGFERGLPIDRYYVEAFLAARAADVRGRVLEVGERTYTKRYGADKVAKSDVLHVVEGDPEATIIADLTSAEHIPSDSFDCVILTQTLQLIYDVDAAIATIHRILKPGGVLLATFPGISQTYDNEWGGNWCWSFTRVSAQRLFGDVFGAGQVGLETYGNVLAAISFLHGLAVEELTPAELDYHEPGYDVTIAVRARKAGGPPDRAVRPGEKRAVTSGGVSQTKAAVLMYHRVSSGHADPWWLCVDPIRFDEQMAILRRHADVLTLDGCLDALSRGATARPVVAVTFDDGYADNLHAALPVLERHGIPATVFVASGYIGGEREFWWDALEDILLSPRDLPTMLQLTAGGQSHTWAMPEADRRADAMRPHVGWHAPDDPPTERHEMFVAVWRLMQALPAEEQDQLLAALRRWADTQPGARATHRPMTEQELTTMSRSPLIAIGAHSVTHPILNDFTPETQRLEIESSRATLRRLLDKPIDHFAYPYGAYRPETLTLVKQAGFRSACTTTEASLRRARSRFELPRFEVKDWNGAQFAERLVRWLD